MNLLGAVVIVTYVSTSVEHAFSRVQDIFKVGFGLHLILGYVPLMTTALMLAEVSRVVRVEQ